MNSKMSHHEYEALFGWMRSNPTWARAIINEADELLEARNDRL